jgi:hypothetical protein
VSSDDLERQNGISIVGAVDPPLPLAELPVIDMALIDPAEYRAVSGLKDVFWSTSLLDQSFISTIHGFGRRLLVEYAFEAGRCPTPRLLAEDEEQLLLRKAIARVDHIEPLSRELNRFGYRNDFTSGATDAEQFRHRILSAVHLLRIIGGEVDRSRRLHHCLEVIRQKYGHTEDAEILTSPIFLALEAPRGWNPGFHCWRPETVHHGLSVG